MADVPNSFLPLDGLAVGHSKKYGRSSRDTSFLQPLQGKAYWAPRFNFHGTIPMYTMSVVVSFGASFRASGTLPMVTMRAHGGWRSSTKLPIITMVGHAIVVSQWDSSTTYPLFTMNAQFNSGSNWSVSNVLPMLTAQTRMGWRSSTKLPMISMSASGTHSVTAAASMLLPMYTMHNDWHVESMPFTSHTTVPMLVSGMYINASMLLPMYTMAAMGKLTTAQFEAWCMNLRTKAVTHWTNLPFTQLATINGKTYGIGAAGLYLLGGDTDDGDPIQWSFETGLDDFDKSGIKRIPYLYLNGIIDGEVEITLIDDRNREYTYYYNTMSRGPVHMPHRRKLGNGIRTRNVAFRIASTTGAYVELDALEPEITVTQRSI